LSVFSGHDYTILGLLGLIKGTESLKTSAGFASCCILELWEGDEPFAGSVFAADVPTSNKFVRVKYNSNPFFDYTTGCISPEVQMANEVVLKEFSLAELEQLVIGVKAEQEKIGMLRVEIGGDSSQNECHSIGVSPFRTNVTAEERLRLANELDTFIAKKRAKTDVDTSLLACSEDNG